MVNPGLRAVRGRKDANANLDQANDALCEHARDSLKRGRSPRAGPSSQIPQSPNQLRPSRHSLAHYRIAQRIATITAVSPVIRSVFMSRRVLRGAAGAFRNRREILEIVRYGTRHEKGPFRGL